VKGAAGFRASRLSRGGHGGGPSRRRPEAVLWWRWRRSWRAGGGVAAQELRGAGGGAGLAGPDLGPEGRGRGVFVLARCSVVAGVPAAPGYSAGRRVLAARGRPELGGGHGRGAFILAWSCFGGPMRGRGRLAPALHLPQGQRWKVAGGLTPDAAGCLPA
jgi:hypothetical protein